MDQTDRDFRKRQDNRILDVFRLSPYQRKFEENSRDRQRELIDRQTHKEVYIERLKSFAKQAGEECERLIDAGEKCQNHVNDCNQARGKFFGNYEVPQLDSLCSHLKSFNDIIQ